MKKYNTHDYEGLLAETIKIKSENKTFDTWGDGKEDEINAYFAKPITKNPDEKFPVVVLIHHLPGWDELYKEFTRKFAHHGFLAICPDLYFREGNGSPEDVAAQVRSLGGVSDKQVIGDLLGTANYISGLDIHNGKFGLFGTCSGGRHGFLTGCKTDKFDAIVECWGGNVIMDESIITDKQPESPASLTKDFSGSLLGLFGNDDVSPPPEQVDEHERLLKEHNKDYVFHRYDGAGHGFMYHDRPLYKQEQSVDAWVKILDFFENKLGV